MEDMRQQAAASALAKQQRERWEKSLSSEPLRGAKNLAGDVGSALLGDLTRFDTDSSREAMSAAPISDTNPGISGSGVMGTIGSDPQANAKTRGGERERSLQGEAHDSYAQEHHAEAERLEKQQMKLLMDDRYRQAIPFADGRDADSALEWDNHRYQVGDLMVEEDPQTRKDIRGEIDEGQQSIKENNQLSSENRDAHRALTQEAADLGVSSINRTMLGEEAAATADMIRQLPPSEFAPGEGDIEALERVQAERRNLMDRAPSMTMGEALGGASPTGGAGAVPDYSELQDVRERSASLEKGLGVEGYGQAGRDAEHARTTAGQDYSRAMLQQAIREGDQDMIDRYSEKIKNAQEYARGREADVAGHEKSIRQGVTAGIEPGPSVGERVANTVGGVAAATLAPAAGQYARTQDTYEQLRHLSLQMAREPLTLQHLKNTQTLGTLLRDRGLADRLYSEGLIDQEVQERLTAKRAQHGY